MSEKFTNRKRQRLEQRRRLHMVRDMVACLQREFPMVTLNTDWIPEVEHRINKDIQREDNYLEQAAKSSPGSPNPGGRCCDVCGHQSYGEPLCDVHRVTETVGIDFGASALAEIRARELEAMPEHMGQLQRVQDFADVGPDDYGPYKV